MCRLRNIECCYLKTAVRQAITADADSVFFIGNAKSGCGNAV